MPRTPVTRGQKVSRQKIELARSLRSHQTAAEKMFWRAVRGRRFSGLKFRRQQVIAGFVADFYCDELRLVVELDGGSHLGRQVEDREREVLFASMGLTVVRFTNEEIIDDLPGALGRLADLTPGPKLP